MCPIYEIRYHDIKGILQMTRMYGGVDMIEALDKLVKNGCKIISCIAV
jgi:hypothetical protein